MGIGSGGVNSSTVGAEENDGRVVEDDDGSGGIKGDGVGFDGAGEDDVLPVGMFEHVVENEGWGDGPREKKSTAGVADTLGVG